MTIGAKLLEVGEFAECLAALEAAIKPREVSPARPALTSERRLAAIELP